MFDAIFERFAIWTEDSGLVGAVVLFASLSVVGLAVLVVVIALTEVLFRAFGLR